MTKQSHFWACKPKETILEKDTGTPVLIEPLFTIASTWELPRFPSTDEWIRKLWYTYTVEYYSVIKGMHLRLF